MIFSRRFFSLCARLAVLSVALAANAAQEEAVLWDFSLKPTTVRRGEAVMVSLFAAPQDPWYFYAHTLKGEGPTPAQFRFDLPPGLQTLGAIEAPPAGKKFDQGFQREVEYYHDPTTFQQKILIGEAAPLGETHVKGTVRFQACNNVSCLPPRDVPFDLALTIEAGPAREEFKVPAATKPTPVPVTPATSPTVAVQPAAPKAGISAAATSSQAISQAMSSGFAAFILLAIIQGFLALTTPCVYPMIPITVSFFIKQGEREGRRPVWLAVTYAFTITVTFTSVGLLLAAIYGPAGTSRLGASPIANLILAVFFIAFALSLFGLFEIQVPASLQGYFAAKGRGGGYSGAIFMGVAFTLASLACTAPFIGALLGLAAGGQWFWPLVGMLGFSTAFALPFFLLALFPQFLARMPKSGGWLNAVKVVMGFLVLAVALKFLDNSDAVWGWGVFTRPVILATWTMIAVFAGSYLLGLIRLPHDTPLEHVGVVRMILSLGFFTFGLYLATGLFGMRINGTLDAFLPAAEIGAVGPVGPVGQVGQIGQVGQGAGLSSSLQWLDNYAKALARARVEHKPILIDFTGITCTNCKWMERNIFVRDDVARAMSRFVLARLQTDNGPDWEKNQKMQVDRFGTAALPLYVIMGPDDRELARLAGLTRDPAKFIAFLEEGSARLKP